jgi:hypothetical protein
MEMPTLDEYIFYINWFYFNKTEFKQFCCLMFI